MKAPMQVLVARHPEVVANVERRFVGVGESPYTDLGEQQAERLAGYIAGWGPTAVHCSPRRRACDTATRAAELAGVEMHVDEGLAEIDFGAAEGLTYEEAKVRGVDVDLLGGPPESAPFRDGETWHEFAFRVEQAARDIEECGPRIAVITHGGVVRALVTQWLVLSHRTAWRFAVPNASVATLAVAGGEGTLLTFGIVPGDGERGHGGVWAADRLG
jgi:broad specificity phosphatase PhoE